MSRRARSWCSSRTATARAWRPPPGRWPRARRHRDRRSDSLDCRHGGRERRRRARPAIWPRASGTGSSRSRAAPARPLSCRWASADAPAACWSRSTGCAKAPRSMRRTSTCWLVRGQRGHRRSRPRSRWTPNGCATRMRASEEERAPLGARAARRDAAGARRPEGVARLRSPDGGRRADHEAIELALAQIELSIRNLQALITELRPAALDQIGLLPALEALLKRVAATSPASTSRPTSPATLQEGERTDAAGPGDGGNALPARPGVAHQRR